LGERRAQPGLSWHTRGKDALTLDFQSLGSTGEARRPSLWRTPFVFAPHEPGGGQQVAVPGVMLPHVCYDLNVALWPEFTLS